MRDEQAPGPWASAAHRAADGVGSWWDRLSFTPKIVAITAGLLVLCWGGFGLVGLFTDLPSRARAPSGDAAPYAEEMPEAEDLPPEATTGAMPSDAPGSPTTLPGSTTAGPGALTFGSAAPTTGPGITTTGPAAGTIMGTPAPVVETRTVTETEAIPYDTQTVNDNSLPKGTQAVVTSGVPGIRTLTYKVTFTDGVQTSKELVQSVVTQDPVTEVVAIGTMPTSRCDPNYSGCVPIASDVDCAGDGDGPAYVYSPVDVIGTDIYGLDPDGNGIGCDS